ncbi:MAG: hypothetical protein ACF8MJ_00275 [Phycisphaerales bacterium JB050]
MADQPPIPPGRRPLHPEDNDPLFDPFPDEQSPSRPIVVYGPDGSGYVHPADLPDERPSAPPQHTGFRIGPMVFVPELRRRGSDPWAHRKAEPRFFALYWSLYLMICAMLTIFAVRSVGMPSRVQFTFGCQAMIFLSLVGSCVLFPMTRLSQYRPRNPFRALMVDAMIVVLPVAAIIVPMPMLTNWPLPIAGALILLVVSWTAFTTAPVFWALREPQQSSTTRVIAMLLILITIGFGPVLTVVAGWTGLLPPQDAMAAGGGGGVGGLGGGLFAYASPFTAAPAITASAPNMRASLSLFEWVLIALPMILSLGAFAIAGAWSPWRSTDQDEMTPHRNFASNQRPDPLQ